MFPSFEKFFRSRLVYTNQESCAVLKCTEQPVENHGNIPMGPQSTSFMRVWLEWKNLKPRKGKHSHKMIPPWCEQKVDLTWMQNCVVHTTSPHHTSPFPAPPHHREWRNSPLEGLWLQPSRWKNHKIQAFTNTNWSICSHLKIRRSLAFTWLSHNFCMTLPALKPMLQRLCGSPWHPKGPLQKR